MKRLVLIVEGHGEISAIPSLVAQVQAALPLHLQGNLFLDGIPIRVRGIHNIMGRKSNKLINALGIAGKRSNLGAVLVVLDGDADQVEGASFCASTVAKVLASRARQARAGEMFSFGVVFLQPEYESILISVAEQFAELKTDIPLPSNIEEAPRDAKGWLNANLKEGYRPTADQARLTRLVTDWTPANRLRCFRRLTHAIEQLATAVQSGQHVVSPS